MALLEQGLEVTSGGDPFPFLPQPFCNEVVGIFVTSSYTSLTAAPPGSSSGSIPPPGTIH